jgi:RNA polymerase sigma factor (sigma-70 family)
VSRRSEVDRTVDAVWKLESARIVAGLMRLVHDVGVAEELAQDALVAALEQWPASGVPDNPGAWLTAIARRRAVDHIRRSRRLDRRHEQLARELARDTEGTAPDPEQVPEQDDVLRLMFISCHPLLPSEVRAALTLRVVAGLSTAEIARAFLVPEPVIAQRLAAAKRTLSEAQVPFELPPPAELAERLSSVLEVVYLIFNEGYSATEGDDLLRPELTLEALRLGRLLAEAAPDEAEVHGLVALMEIQASRVAARTGPDGEPVPLHEQNRGLWDHLLIRRGFTAMLRARDIGGTPGPYVLQAAIAVCHAQARTAADTDWAQIATLYDNLIRLLPTPIVRLNRAVAVGMARGPQDGLDLVDALSADPRLRDYHLLPGVRGDLLVRLGRHAEARREFERAADLARNAAESTFLRRRAAELTDGEPSGITLGEAADDFLARGDLDSATVRSYGQTLRRLRRTLGDRLPMAALTTDEVARAFQTAWSAAAPATWNRHVAACRSFAAWAGAGHLAAVLSRRAPTSRTGPARAFDLEVLLLRDDIRLRERTLWRLLYESAAGVSAVLSLNVEDLDLDERRARSRGGAWVSWRAGTARLLPELVAGRTRGPVFLADRRPVPSRPLADSDRCPETGRRRLSYERAEYLFKQATRPLDPAGDGYTLSRLKPGSSRPAPRRPAGPLRMEK